MNATVTSTLDAIEAMIRDMYERGVALATNGANKRALIEYASGCYWGLVNMQHAAVFGGTCDESALWGDAAAWWLAETLGM